VEKGYFSIKSIHSALLKKLILHVKGQVFKNTKTGTKYGVQRIEDMHGKRGIAKAIG
jgi:hypothetical protein